MFTLCDKILLLFELDDLIFHAENRRDSLK